MIQRRLTTLKDDLEKEPCWVTTTEPVITFVCDTGAILGFSFYHLVLAQYDPEHEQLLIQWPPGTITITGPKALEFYKEFARGKGTWIKSDGKDILSVTFHSTQDAAGGAHS